jgi:hypothetical protein
MRPSIALLLILAGCDGEPAPIDAGRDAGPRLLLPRCEDTEALGTDMLDHVPSTLIGTIAPSVARLSVPGSESPAEEDGELMYRELGYDRVVRAAGQDHTLRTDLGGSAPSGVDRRSIAWFMHLADFQLVDDESPARLAIFDNPDIDGGLRTQEAYLPRAISAMNRTLARIEHPARPYDFGVITGDCTDSAQENELRWLVALMNGTPGLHTDSGADDDLVPGPDNDPKDPFDPTAFPAPWLFVHGNHDVMVVGNGLIDASQERTAIGTTPFGGTRDYRAYYAPVSTREVPADPERHLLSRAESVAILLADDAAVPGPPGHGFTPSSDLAHGANFVHDAIDGLLRIIGLDTNDDTGGSRGLVHRATVDEFLIPELERAAGDGVLVMLASHHATSAIDVFSGELGMTVVADAVPPDELEALVASHPHVIAWLVGHNHRHRVRPIAGTTTPGYWEIMTSAMSDFPGQTRAIELVDNADGTLSILNTVIDFDADDCMERRYRRLMTMEHVTAWGSGASFDPLDLNVELVIPTPASAQTAIDGATRHTRIESETTLRGL